MYRGPLPGFYFDEEKKKYFRIQEHHNAPPNAKYSRANVLHETTAGVKRKLEEEQLGVQRRQTVTRALSACHPLLAVCGLQRESGTLERAHAYLNGARGPAMINLFEASSMEIHDLNIDGLPNVPVRLIDAQYMHNSGRFVMTCSSGFGYYFVIGVDWANDASCHSDIYQYFRSEVINTSVIPYHGGSGPDMIAACDRSGDVRMWPALNRQPIVKLPQVQMNLPYSLWASKAQCDTRKIAFVGSGKARVFDLETITEVCPGLAMDPEVEFFSMDWLNHSTMAMGVTDQGQHSVHLWDIRVQGVAQRISRRFRVTGIDAPNTYRNDLVVTSARDISLYDLRYLDPKAPPVISIPHTSNGPKIEFSVWDGKLVAAVDQFGRVQTYALGTGAKLRSLTAPQTVHAGDPIRNPRWTEDERGAPFLQACHGKSILRWAWQGDDALV